MSTLKAQSTKERLQHYTRVRPSSTERSPLANFDTERARRRKGAVSINMNFARWESVVQWWAMCSVHQAGPHPAIRVGTATRKDCGPSKNPPAPSCNRQRRRKSHAAGCSRKSSATRSCRPKATDRRRHQAGANDQKRPSAQRQSDKNKMHVNSKKRKKDEM